MQSQSTSQQTTEILINSLSNLRTAVCRWELNRMDKAPTKEHPLQYFVGPYLNLLFDLEDISEFKPITDELICELVADTLMTTQFDVERELTFKTIPTLQSGLAMYQGSDFKKDARNTESLDFMYMMSLVLNLQIMIYRYVEIPR